MENNEIEKGVIKILNSICPTNDSIAGAFITIDEQIKAMNKIIKLFKGQALSKEESSDAWISVEDRLPNDSINCLVYFKNNEIKDEWVETAYYTDGVFYLTVGHPNLITHWMHLPKSPTKEGKGK